MQSQANFPACAVNHAPVYYCCQYGNNKEVFTKFHRPTGDALDAYFDAGWKLPRKVNFPDAFYTPKSPEFEYTEPDTVCRMQRIVMSDGSVKDELQCGPGTKISDSMGGRIVTNASVPATALDATVYFTSHTNPRNNNATFPIGAVCTSLMTASGQVDHAAKANCTTAPPANVFQINTFTEGPLLFIYGAYGLLLALLVLWVPVRSYMAVLFASRATLGPVKTRENMVKLFDENSNGLAMPMLTKRRDSEVELRANAETVEQVGYRDTLAGAFVRWYFIILTIGLFPIMIIVILDSNHKFQPMLFDPVNVLIIVYMVIWLVTTVWLSLIVIYYHRLGNFFRVREPLDRCQYVNMFNPEATEIMLADRSGVSGCVAKIESFLFRRARTGYEKTIEVKFTEDGHRFVEFQHLRYIYDEFYGKFVPGTIPLPETFEQFLEQSEGLNEVEYCRRLATVGKNSIEVPMPTMMQSIVQEVVSFFYIYELMCYYVWYFTGYWNVTVVNTAIIIGVMTINIVSRRRMMANILKMTRYASGVAVRREGIWQTIKSSELVPGDLVRVVENWVLPCDLVLIKGNVLCDESSLTGESMPVQKFPIPTNSHEVYDPDDHSGKKHTLFAGAKTLASGRSATTAVAGQKTDEVLALVTFTGAHTVRGQLIQSILYPALVRFKYDEHLKACIVFLFCYGLIAAYIAMKFLMDNAGLSNTLFAFVYGMFMLSAVLSPLIPVVLTVSQANASKRLLAKGIFALNPQRIALAGKIRVFAFDKTGTITKEGLDFRGCMPVQVNASERRTTSHIATFLPEFSDMTSPHLNLMMKFALATCHAVGYMDEKLVGNEVEVKMFQSTTWKLVEEILADERTGHDEIRTIVESPDQKYALEIIKRYEFDNHRMSMSVVVEDLQTRRRFVFCKGSYEKIKDIATSSSLPNDYTLQAEKLAKDGCYVLGVAFKEISGSDTELLHQSRDEIENGLCLLGLIMFQNELKEDSANVISELKNGDIRAVMITGDNAMTGCYIARASGMVRGTSRVILGDIMAVNAQGGKALVWKDVDTQEVLSNREIHKLMENGVESDSIELAVTGVAFNYLSKMGELSKLLFRIRIFSRMTPAGKADCVAEMMAAGAVTGMCGDGGNDCGALRIAHVGVALSDADASVVSPFTSCNKSISAVLTLCKEGRCSLATSFANIKFLIIYGLVGCGLRFTMYSNAVFMSEWAFIFGDGFVLVFLSYAISLAKPLDTLGKQRPTSSLVGATTILSMLGQEVIHVVFLVIGVNMLTNQPWYCPFNPQNVDLTKWWQLQDSHLATTIFLMITPQQMIGAFAYSLGSRFRQPIWRNYVLVGYFVTLLMFLISLSLGEPSRVTDQFRIASSTNVIGLPDIPMPRDYRQNLLLLSIANMVVIVLFEHVVILGPVRTFFRTRFHRDTLRLRL
ncbi:TPA: hypothetical protein N0F65_008876 [Lagenidium giganteum]|uniref:P-type ATPase A domain-containing protein n=1 Tax=Lagenidium giganteum TaxID=4803 RepID=A0AAV2YWB6_9STRA|nr:TPA: hypothetical protein N0F65_008876 [Lagenidium giganteum]